MRRWFQIEGILKGFERLIVLSLIVMMAVVVLLSTAELGYIIYREITAGPLHFPGIDQLLDIFGFFLLILIGVELLETIKAYMAEHVVHVEIVLEVALIAIARKVIILDYKDLPGEKILGIAALILALALAFLLEKWGRRGGGGAGATTSGPSRP